MADGITRVHTSCTQFACFVFTLVFPLKFGVGLAPRLASLAMIRLLLLTPRPSLFDLHLRQLHAGLEHIEAFNLVLAKRNAPCNTILVKSFETWIASRQLRMHANIMPTDKHR
eukprot:gnl/TRDRNA2_/TRDRNA2_116500_c1_seq2.p2 gnl/TRDRNA2_/TRDRNA2_116500_c1~~gnl/TRDRNA2_/TRDRNA2_116500_c1_seq2.p2  ORF type:complete len:113 (-),score=18.25 gnl/TRDRNA2_/TRDRNA2_116500_c1_seq2:88-426(-)